MARIGTRPVFAGIGLLVVGAIFGCSDAGSRHAGDLGHIRSTGELTVVTRNAPTTYYLGRDAKPAGPEHAMVVAFAKSLGLDKITYRVAGSVSAVLHTLAEGKADIAAAGLTATAARRKRFLFGPAYRTVRPQVVCHADSAKPADIDALAGVDLVVTADSSYAERLKTLRAQHPKLEWRTADKASTRALLRRVAQHKADCTVANSNIVDIDRRYYPSLQVMFDLGAAQSLAWALPQTASDLRDAIGQWFEQYRSSGALADTNAQYYDYIAKFDYVDRKALIERIDKRYPQYAQAFSKAAAEYDLPVSLLAAQAYQESKWNPKAKGPSGAQGMMMLARRTAKAMGVKDRMNAAASIRGGAKYLAQMKKKVGDGPSQRDRTLIALAAYNIGYAHVLDAQRLAKRLGRDPDRWADLRNTLPLLADKRYYPSLKYGYARGTEAVRYVQRVRDYADVIAQHVD